MRERGEINLKPLPPSEVDSWLSAQEEALPEQARVVRPLPIPPSRTPS